MANQNYGTMSSERPRSHAPPSYESSVSSPTHLRLMGRNLRIAADGLRHVKAHREMVMNALYSARPVIKQALKSLHRLTGSLQESRLASHTVSSDSTLSDDDSSVDEQTGSNDPLLPPYDSLDSTVRLLLTSTHHLQEALEYLRIIERVEVAMRFRRLLRDDASFSETLEVAASNLDQSILALQEIEGLPLGTQMSVSTSAATPGQLEAQRGMIDDSEVAERLGISAMLMDDSGVPCSLCIYMSLCFICGIIIQLVDVDNRQPAVWGNLLLGLIMSGLLMELVFYLGCAAVDSAWVRRLKPLIFIVALALQAVIMYTWMSWW